MKQEIHLQSSIPLTQEEVIMLSGCLPTSGDLVADPHPVKFHDFSNASPIEETEQNSAGWQYSFGVDLSTILILLFSPLPAFFLKKVAEEAGSDFWTGIKKLVAGIKERKKGIPIKSIQIQLYSTTEDGIPLEYVITYLNAQYVNTDTLIHLIQKSMNDMDTLLVKNISHIRSSKKARKNGKIVLHAIIDGSNKPNLRVGKDGLL